MNLSINLKELKSLLESAFEQGNNYYLDLKEECLDKIIENYLKSKNKNSGEISLSVNENIDSSYYYYYTSDNLQENQISIDSSVVSIF